MVSVAAWFYVVSYQIAAVTLVVIIFIALVCPKRLVQLGDWLKGSRTSYYFRSKPPEQDGRPALRATGLRLKDEGVRAWHFVGGGSVIEINRGPFRRRSAIYGQQGFWKVARSYLGSPLQDEGDRVNMIDTWGLPVETALKLVNAKMSLQGLLNRIAELEKRQKSAEAKFQMVYAAVVALRFQILSDKQRY